MDMEYFRCCAAISLNNTAITLMERQQHYLSYETLRDGLSLFADNEGGHPMDTFSTQERDALDRASKRLSESTCPLGRIARRTDVPLIDVVPTTDAPSLRLLAASLRGRGSDDSFLLHVAPIRIEPTDTESINGLDDQLLIKAIMLYNYSVSLQCAWRSMLGYRNEEGGNDSRWLGRHKVRLHVLREATEITSKLCMEAFACDGDRNRKSTVDPGKALSVAIVVHSSYLRALEEAGAQAEAADCSVKLFLLNNVLASVLGDRIIQPHVSTASAA